MKKIFYMLAILVFVCLLADNSKADSIPVQWGGNGHWYQRVDLEVGISWDDAKAAAVARGGYLATITSYNEDYFVIENLIIPVETSFPLRPREGQYFPYWIGGYQEPQEPGSSSTNVGWKWITGEAWGYTNWYGTEPNDAGGPYGDGKEDTGNDAENFLTYWTETNMNSGVLNYGWNDLRGNSGENRLGYFVEYNTNPVPEPTTMLLLGSGLLGLFGLKRKFRK